MDGQRGDTDHPNVAGANSRLSVTYVALSLWVYVNPLNVCGIVCNSRF